MRGSVESMNQRSCTMTPSRRRAAALTVAAALLFTFPALAAPADAWGSPVLDRVSTLWSQLWSGIDRFLPGDDAGPSVDRATAGSGALLNPDGFAPSDDDGDSSGALLNPDGDASGALLNPDG